MSIVMLCKAESTVLDVAVSEVLHRNLEVSRWVKYRIHGFCKLVGFCKIVFSCGWRFIGMGD